jgi:hypothetical protein
LHDSYTLLLDHTHIVEVVMEVEAVVAEEEEVVVAEEEVVEAA